MAERVGRIAVQKQPTAHLLASPTSSIALSRGSLLVVCVGSEGALTKRLVRSAPKPALTSAPHCLTDVDGHSRSAHSLAKVQPPSARVPVSVSSDPPVQQPLPTLLPSNLPLLAVPRQSSLDSMLRETQSTRGLPQKQAPVASKAQPHLAKMTSTTDSFRYAPGAG